MHPPDPNTDAQLRAAMRRSFLIQQAVTRRIQAGDGLLVPGARPSEEHYHLIYTVPKDDVSIPDFTRLYVTSKEAYEKVWEMGQAAEPNVEWGEDGRVGLETRLHGRADLWWVVLEVAACIRSACLKTMSRADQKKRLILLPGDR